MSFLGAHECYAFQRDWTLGTGFQDMDLSNGFYGTGLGGTGLRALYLFGFSLFAVDKTKMRRDRSVFNYLEGGIEMFGDKLNCR